MVVTVVHVCLGRPDAFRYQSEAGETMPEPISAPPYTVDRCLSYSEEGKRAGKRRESNHPSQPAFRDVDHLDRSRL